MLSRIWPLSEKHCVIRRGVRKFKRESIPWIDMDTAEQNPQLVEITMDFTNLALILDATTGVELAVCILEKVNLEGLHPCYNVTELRKRLKNILTKHEEEQ